MDPTTEFQTLAETALEFLIFAHLPQSPYSGTIFITVQDSISKSNFQRYVRVFEGKVEMYSELSPSANLSCSVTLGKDTLMGIIGGTLDPMITFMCGQVIIDNPMALVSFAQAFELNPQKFEQFRQKLEAEAEVEQNLIQTLSGEKEPLLTQQENSSSIPISPSIDLSSILIRKSFILLQSVQNLAIELSKNKERLVQNEQYRALASKLEEAKQRIYASSTYQSLQSNPNLQVLKEFIASQLASYHITETYEGYKNKATEYLVSYLIQRNEFISASPILSKEEKKKQLLMQLEQLKEHNKELEVARQNRLNGFHKKQKK